MKTQLQPSQTATKNLHSNKNPFLCVSKEATNKVTSYPKLAKLVDVANGGWMVLQVVFQVLTPLCYLKGSPFELSLDQSGIKAAGVRPKRFNLRVSSLSVIYFTS